MKTKLKSSWPWLILIVFAIVLIGAALLWRTLGNKDITSTSEAYEEHLMSGDADLTAGEKRVLAALGWSSRLELSADSRYQLELPFEAETLVFSSDRKEVAAVDDAGTIIPVRDGQCIIAANADGVMLYTVVTVTGTGVTPETDPYAAYTQEGYDADTIRTEIEVYASITNGFTIQDSLLDNDPVRETTFTAEFGHTGCEVKYKLLTVLNTLQEAGFKSLAMDTEQTDTQIVCRFYAS